MNESERWYKEEREGFGKGKRKKKRNLARVSHHGWREEKWGEGQTCFTEAFVLPSSFPNLILSPGFLHFFFSLSISRFSQTMKEKIHMLFSQFVPSTVEKYICSLRYIMDNYNYLISIDCPLLSCIFSSMPFKANRITISYYFKQWICVVG